ncbi:S1-like domain-containing RNA-binding protein [bacterium]|nr:S1-like domain-containing RNA-binding protein [bacterium]
MMAEIGKYNHLRVVKELDFGLYLDGGELGEILLPRRYVPPHCEVDSELEVFIYLDSEDRVIATTEEPLGTVGEFAYLKAVSVGKIGAFMDWGLMKDLLVPFREQKLKVEEGRSYVTYIYLDDESNRIVGSCKVEKYLDNIPPEFKLQQEVDLMIFAVSPLGYKAIINGTHSGVLYENEVFQNLRIGDKLKGYIKKVREDDKIDLSLQPEGYKKMDDLSEKIMAVLKQNENFLDVTDKSPAERISALFGMSKKNYKKAVGGLYKKGIITMEDNGIKLKE